jgi:hypothetical protein
MNGRNVLILIAASLAISVTFYYLETVKQKHEIDTLRKGLSGAERFLKSNSNISFKGEPSKIELYMWSRYILAPRFIAYQTDTDTTLIIQYLLNGDSALNAFIAGREILYEQKDTSYRYLITARKRYEPGK